MANILKHQLGRISKLLDRLFPQRIETRRIYKMFDEMFSMNKHNSWSGIGLPIGKMGFATGKLFKDQLLIREEEEARKRASDKDHRQEYQHEAIWSLDSITGDSELSLKIVNAIQNGSIPHVFLVIESNKNL